VKLQYASYLLPLHPGSVEQEGNAGGDSHIKIFLSVWAAGGKTLLCRLYDICHFLKKKIANFKGLFIPVPYIVMKTTTPLQPHGRLNPFNDYLFFDKIAYNVMR